MNCPYCHYKETQVVDSRVIDNGYTVRRRRECPRCKKRFTTYEKIESIITVIKRDGRKENFDREKLKRGILRACDKTNIGIEEVKKICDSIELSLRAKGGEVKSREIGNMIMRKLKKLDKIAYVRFASVYKKFKDVEDFEREINKLK